jgi:hypothetical protein
LNPENLPGKEPEKKRTANALCPLKKKETIAFEKFAHNGLAGRG